MTLAHFFQSRFETTRVIFCGSHCSSIDYRDKDGVDSVLTVTVTILYVIPGLVMNSCKRSLFFTIMNTD